MSAGATTRDSAARGAGAGKPLGLMAMGVAVVCFSLTSTLAKKAAVPGPTLAFWRITGTTVIWWCILGITEKRTIKWAEVKRALIPGVVFGLNMTAFFTGVTRTSVANAELIASLTPLLVVPAGAILFKEHINPRALWFGVVSLGGLVLVLFGGPKKGQATWFGNGIVFCAIILWGGYLLTSRRLRDHMSVQGIMTSVMTIAALTVTPIAFATGDVGRLTVHAVPYVSMLAVMTGVIAHGLIVFAQRTVSLGTITILQVAQPALAVGWAYLLLSQGLRPVQILGIALVLGGILAVVLVTRRTASRLPEPIGLEVLPEGAI